MTSLSYLETPYTSFFCAQSFRFPIKVFFGMGVRICQNSFIFYIARSHIDLEEHIFRRHSWLGELIEPNQDSLRALNSSIIAHTFLYGAQNVKLINSLYVRKCLFCTLWVANVRSIEYILESYVFESVYSWQPRLSPIIGLRKLWLVQFGVM